MMHFLSRHLLRVTEQHDFQSVFNFKWMPPSSQFVEQTFSAMQCMHAFDMFAMQCMHAFDMFAMRCMHSFDMFAMRCMHSFDMFAMRCMHSFDMFAMQCIRDSENITSSLEGDLSRFVSFLSSSDLTRWMSILIPSELDKFESRSNAKGHERKGTSREKRKC